ncbi:acyltransferase family protein, partial [Neobacillus sp.]|uniref:acyltransferase family protein n=1 Tax=Neobacillus sp. TaxID=2675273 RepID=UPI0037CB515A
MTIPKKQNRRYIVGLDGLRALAVFAVIFYHIGFPWATGGFLGVVVFFVLSGYLITDIIMTEW